MPYWFSCQQSLRDTLFRAFSREIRLVQQLVDYYSKHSHSFTHTGYRPHVLWDHSCGSSTQDDSQQPEIQLDRGSRSQASRASWTHLCWTCRTWLQKEGTPCQQAHRFEYSWKLEEKTVLVSSKIPLSVVSLILMFWGNLFFYFS